MSNIPFLHGSKRPDDEVKEQAKRIAELEAREKLWRDYVEFLGKASPTDIAWVHGWRCSDQDFKRGEQFRKDLGIAEGTGGGE